MIKDFILQKEFGYLLDNKWVEPQSDKYIDILSPQDNSLVGAIPSLNEDEIDKCILSSNKAFLLWKDKSINQRTEILKRVSQIIRDERYELTNLIINEVGKPYKDSYDEVMRTSDIIDFYAEEGRRIFGDVLLSESFPGFGKEKIAITKRVPLGVTLAIPPFNYPLNETIPKIIGAIIPGNTVILKAPQQGGITCMVIGEIFRLAGLDDGVLNIVSGENNVVGDYLVRSEYIKAINFTGGTKTAIHIQREVTKREDVIPVMLLGLSGKDASIVLKDADIKKSVTNIAQGAFSYSGQRCTAIKRVLIDQSIEDEFIKELVKEVKENFILGDPKDKNTTIGPVINDKAAMYLNELKKDAIDKGAKIVLEGENKGRFIYPIILSNVSLDMRIAWEEPFSPILPIIKIKDKNEAIDIANQSEYGLQSSVFTENISDAFYIAERLDVGNVQINGKDSRGPDNFPFNGVKKSGIGNIQGAKYLIESLSRIKTFVINLEDEK